MENATPGMPWIDVAAHAYEAYAAVTENKNSMGWPMPAFDALPEKIKKAWKAAVKEAVHCATTPYRHKRYEDVE